MAALIATASNFAPVTLLRTWIVSVMQVLRRARNGVSAEALHAIIFLIGRSNLARNEWVPTWPAWRRPRQVKRKNRRQRREVLRQAQRQQRNLLRRRLRLPRNHRLEEHRRA